MHETLDLGASLDITTLQRGLREIDPDIHFDVGGNLNLTHPRLSEWCGVFCRGQHITSMDRGPTIPEYNVYAVKTAANGEKTRSHAVRVGWRTTLEKLVRSPKCRATWPALCAKFGIEYKHFMGHAAELEV